MPSPLVGSPACAGSQVELPGMYPQSDQLRVSLETTAFAYRRAQLAVHCAEYLLRLDFSAVLPSPNRSYAALSRGSTLGPQFGRFDCSAKYRAGAKRPASMVDSFIDELNQETRTPGLTVRRF